MLECRSPTLPQSAPVPVPAPASAADDGRSAGRRSPGPLHPHGRRAAPFRHPHGAPDHARAFPHALGRAVDHLLNGRPHHAHRHRAEALRDIETMRPNRTIPVCELLRHVLGEIRRSAACLLCWPVPEALLTTPPNVDDPTPPCRCDQLLRDVPPNPEMQMQPVTTRMPLRNPAVRERAADLSPQRTKERPDIEPRLVRIPACLRIRQGPQGSVPDPV